MYRSANAISRFYGDAKWQSEIEQLKEKKKEIHILQQQIDSVLCDSCGFQAALEDKP